MLAIVHICYQKFLIEFRNILLVSSDLEKFFPFVKRIIDSKGFGGKLRYTIFLFLSKLFDNNRKLDVYKTLYMLTFVVKFGIVTIFYRIE